MTAARRLLAQRRLAMLIFAAALVLKLLVPGGYMIGNQQGRLSIEICSGVASEPMTMPGMSAATHDHGGMDHHRGDHGKAEMPCAFSGLAAASLGAVDPVQLAALLAFVMAAALRPLALTATPRRVHLRPPLRGPPAAA